jgi:hypothetical protein
VSCFESRQAGGGFPQFRLEVVELEFLDLDFVFPAEMSALRWDEGLRGVLLFNGELERTETIELEHLVKGGGEVLGDCAFAIISS